MANFLEWLGNLASNPPSWDSQALANQSNVQSRAKMLGPSTLSPAPNSWEQLKGIERQGADQRATNLSNFGEWMMTLPFSMVPAQQPVNVKVPMEYAHIGDAVRLQEQSVYEYPGLIDSDTPSQRWDSIWNSAWSRTNPNINSTTRDLNIPSQPTPDLITPQAKLALLQAGIRGVGGIVRTITPEPIKAKLPPSVRAMAHYLTGNGEERDLGLNFQKILETSTYDPMPAGDVQTARTLTPAQLKDIEFYSGMEAGTANSIQKMYEHYPNLPWDKLGVSPGTIIRPKNEEDYYTINNFFLGKDESGRMAVQDDYRFYPRDEYSPNDPLTARMAWKSITGGIGEALKGGNKSSLQDYFRDSAAFRTWISTWGKPFPVRVYDKLAQ